MTEDVINLVLETARQHLIGLIKNELLDVIWSQHLKVVCHGNFIESRLNNHDYSTIASINKHLSADHVKDTAGGADNDVLANIQLPHVLPVD